MTYLQIAAVAGLALLGTSFAAFPATAAAETVVVPVEDLRGVQASGQFEIRIIRGETARVVLEGDSEDLRHIRAGVRNGHLVVRHNCTFFCNRDLDVVAYITAPQLERVGVSKGARARVSDVNSAALELDVAMGGALEIAGACGALHASVAMGGTVDGEALRCRSVDADVSMGGTLSVYASERADAEASMGGTVDIDGAPAQRSTSAIMGGSVSFR